MYGKTLLFSNSNSFLSPSLFAVFRLVYFHLAAPQTTKHQNEIQTSVTLNERNRKKVKEKMVEPPREAGKCAAKGIMCKRNYFNEINEANRFPSASSMISIGKVRVKSGGGGIYKLKMKFIIRFS